GGGGPASGAAGLERPHAPARGLHALAAHATGPLEGGPEHPERGAAGNALPDRLG
ncbi:unnamed protein product, partial [Heterosigma akashiwo]